MTSWYSSSNLEKGTFDENNVDDILISLPVDKKKVRQASKSDRVLKEIFVNIINGWLIAKRNFLIIINCVMN